MANLDDKNERLKVQKDILWGLYQEHRTHARHNETLRSTVNNMLIVASAALVSLALYDRDITLRDLPAGILLIGFGLLGFVFSASYTERTVKHKSRANEYAQELDTLVFDEPLGRNLKSIARAADKAYRSIFLMRAIRAVANSHLLWVILPLFIAIIGLFLTFVILRKQGWFF
jgi:hypothetical protein